MVVFDFQDSQLLKELPRGKTDFGGGALFGRFFSTKCGYPRGIGQREMTPEREAAWFGDYEHMAEMFFATRQPPTVDEILDAVRGFEGRFNEVQVNESLVKEFGGSQRYAVRKREK